jgi:hypothetical protein
MLKVLVSALAIFGSYATTLHKSEVRTAGWTISVRRDSFVGSTTCEAHRGPVQVKNGLVVFSLGSTVDTSLAEYRIDAGQPHSVTDVAFRLRVMGAPKLIEPLDNPSRGLVIVPAADLTSAQSVWIRATPKVAPRRFIVSGLSAVAEREAALSCNAA